MQEMLTPSQTPIRKTRRSYTKEFKARVVSECQADGKSIAQVAKLAGHARNLQDRHLKRETEAGFSV